MGYLAHYLRLVEREQHGLGFLMVAQVDVVIMQKCADFLGLRMLLPQQPIWDIGSQEHRGLIRLESVVLHGGYQEELV